MDAHSPDPCPFCGGAARLGCTPHAGEPKVPLLVQCTGADCGATIEGRADEAAVVVVARWNRRATGNTERAKAMKEFPQLDDRYSCKECGMRLQCIAACECDDPKKLTLKCCGKQLTRTPGNADAAAAPSTGPTS